MKNQQIKLNNINIIVDKWGILLEYLYWYLIYSFSIIGIILVFYFNFLVLYILLIILSLIVAILIIPHFIKTKTDKYVLQFGDTEIELLKNNVVIKVINDIKQVSFILSGYKDEPILLSFSHKSGLNKLIIIKKNGSNIYFLFRLNSKKNYDEFMRYKKINAYSYKIIIKNQFLN